MPVERSADLLARVARGHARLIEGSRVVATYNHDDSLERTSRDTQRRLADASAELAESRHRAQSGDGFVSATVNGHGSLLDLKIVPGALRRSPPGVLGPQILSAIQEARADAGELNRARLAEVLDLPPATDTPATDTAARTRRRPRPRDDDEDFSQISYLR